MAYIGCRSLSVLYPSPCYVARTFMPIICTQGGLGVYTSSSIPNRDHGNLHFTMASQKYSINCVGFSIQVVNQIISDILPYWSMPGLEVDIRVQLCRTHCDPLSYQYTRLLDTRFQGCRFFSLRTTHGSHSILPD